MRTADEILKSTLDYKIAIVNNPEYTFNRVLDAMQQYAEEYHQSELLKLNKSDVISSVCICKCGKEASCPVCKDCFIKGLEREQTDL